ncbi:hypothetical protein VCHC57A1_3766, partial [Vibrio cholerae HC-57A1]
MASTYTPS